MEVFSKKKSTLWSRWIFPLYYPFWSLGLQKAKSEKDHRTAGLETIDLLALFFVSNQRNGKENWPFSFLSFCLSLASTSLVFASTILQPLWKQFRFWGSQNQTHTICGIGFSFQRDPFFFSLRPCRLPLLLREVSFVACMNETNGPSPSKVQTIWNAGFLPSFEALHFLSICSCPLLLFR